MDQQNKLYVGNLEKDVNNESLSAMFAEFGEVKEAVVIMDRDTNSSKGFGFVTFAQDADAAKAMAALDGKDGLKVNVARPKTV